MAERYFRVLVATDGSPNGSIAVSTAIAFPWPTRTRVRAIVARGVGMPISRSALVRDAIGDTYARVAASAKRSLARRWPSADAVVADQAILTGILSEARRFRASVIVLGWRGQGAVRRFLMGTVSRGVARSATCPVLIVRHQPQEVRSFLVALDGSANALRAVVFAGRFDASRGASMTLVHVLEPTPLPAGAMLPAGIRATLRREVAARNAEQEARARRNIDAIAATLRKRGWNVRTLVRVGSPLQELLAAVSSTKADILIVGARGVGGLRRLLIGSVAEGALNHSPVPVLIVR